MTPDTLLRARPHLRIAHHVPGRLRIRFAPAVLKTAPEIADNQALDTLESMPGVKKVQLRLMAASLLIEYDPKAMPSETWETILSGPEREARALLERYMPG